MFNSHKKAYIFLIVALLAVAIFHYASADLGVIKYPRYVEQIAYNVDGTLGALTNKVVLRNPSTNTTTIFSPKGIAHSIAFSPDGKYLAAGRGPSFEDRRNDDICIDLWDLESKQLIQLKRSAPLTSDRGPALVNTLAFSPDNRHLATGTGDLKGIVEIWDIPTRSIVKVIDDGAYVKTLIRGSEIIYTLAYSHDGKYLAVGGTAAILSIWDVETGQMVRAFAVGEEGMVTKAVVYSPDDRYLAVAVNRVLRKPGESNPETGKIEIRDAQTGDLVNN